MLLPLPFLEQLAAQNDRDLAMLPRGAGGEDRERLLNQRSVLDSLMSARKEQDYLEHQMRRVSSFRVEEQRGNALEALASLIKLQVGSLPLDMAIRYAITLSSIHADSVVAQKDRRKLKRALHHLRLAIVFAPRFLRLLALISVLILLEFADDANRALAEFFRLAARDANETARPEPPLIRIPSIKQNAPNARA